MRILVLNCGSSTIKYKLFQARTDGLVQLAGGTVEVDRGYDIAVQGILETLPEKPDAVGHRVVHGGVEFRDPVLIDDQVLSRIEALSALAPLHNPPALAGIQAASRLGVDQVAVFDTAFHGTIPEKAWRYALPAEVTDAHHLRRFGFHGISHQYVTETFAEISGIASPTVVTLHLGNGASAAAVKKGRCIDTSMGTTPLEGLVMGTRGGDMDPALPIELIKGGMPVADVEKLLWKQAGLLGLAGESDLRNLLERDDRQAEMALSIFCYRIRKYIGAYMAALEGAEAVIFTGGIGENSAPIRNRCLEGLEFLGIELDQRANTHHGPRITTLNSRVHAYVIPTNEEKLIARETISLLL